MGIILQKIYFRILFIGISFLLLINIISFLVSFNFKQLINPSFYDERVISIYYLSKNFIFETGVNMEEISQEDIEIYMDKAAEIYDVDYNMLALLILKDNQYSITLTGGMGLSAISFYDFNQSSFTNPYDMEENIMAAAETLSKLKLKNLTDEEIIKRFIMGNEESNIKLLAKSEYLRALNAAAEYRNKYITE